MKKFSISNDAYGQEIWAYFKGRGSSEIVEREDGFLTTSKIGPAGYFSEYKDWPQHQKKAIAYARGRVLDIGCGAGRHSIYLQKKGLAVTGIDISPLAIRVCKLRGLKTAKVRSITGVGRFQARSFETVLMLGNNFGLLGNFQRAKWLLKKLYRITSPKAQIIAESLDPYNTDNPFHLQYQRLNKKRGKMPGQIRIRIRFEKYIGKWFDYLLVTRKEMKKILDGTGWRVKRFIIPRNSVYYIAIIEKVLNPKPNRRKDLPQNNHQSDYHECHRGVFVG